MTSLLNVVDLYRDGTHLSLSLVDVLPSKVSVGASRSQFGSFDLELLSNFNGKPFILLAWVMQRVHRLDVRVIAYQKSHWS